MYDGPFLFDTITRASITYSYHSVLIKYYSSTNMVFIFRYRVGHIIPGTYEVAMHVCNVYSIEVCLVSAHMLYIGSVFAQNK